MPVTNYFTVNGQIIGEETSGVRTDYLTDALGSVTATVDQSQNIINTYRWKPFGDLLVKTGTGADPRFLWTGNTGSRTTGAVWAEQYNRARHYGKKQGQWTSVDPLWPGERAYNYVEGRSLTRLDPTGRQTCCDTIPWPPIGGCSRWGTCPPLSDESYSLCAKFVHEGIKKSDCDRAKQILKNLSADCSRFCGSPGSGGTGPPRIRRHMGMDAMLPRKFWTVDWLYAMLCRQSLGSTGFRKLC